MRCGSYLWAEFLSLLTFPFAGGASVGTPAIACGQKQIHLAVACVIVLVASAGNVQAELVFELPTPNSLRNNSYAFGEIFTVGGQDLTVHALGAYDDFGDGFVTPGGIPVGLYRESDGTLLASTNVVSSDPLSGNFRLGSISPVTLLSGEQYQVVAVNLSDAYNTNSTVTTSPLVSRVGWSYHATTNLERNRTDGPDSTGSTTLYMANLDVTAAAPVPEPSSLALFGVGACVAGGFSICRARRAAKLV